MYRRLQFGLAILFWLVLVCSSFVAGLVNGRRNEQRKLEDAVNELRMLEERKHELDHEFLAFFRSTS
jgi:hypothetical protein